jgi:serine/threonine protein kinase
MGGESDGNEQWGGSGGYWGMVEAVCDNEPPTTGPEFSYEFSEFIKSCLRKDPDERGTAEELVNHEFIRANMSPGPDSAWSHRDTNFSCPSPKHSSNSGDDDHGHLSASLATSMVKRISGKEKKVQSKGVTPRGSAVDEPVTFQEESTPVEDVESAEDMVSIETIRTKHLENIITKMVFRDHVEDDFYGAKYGGTFVKGKLIRKESTLDDEGNLQEIEDVDDLFGSRKVPESVHMSKMNSDQNLRKVDRNHADLINSILRLQGSEYESNMDTSVGLTTKAHMPKLFGPDLQKWQNLAVQLHLPLDHVVQVVESKLNETLDQLRKEKDELLQEEEGATEGKRSSSPRQRSDDSADDENARVRIITDTSVDILSEHSKFSPEQVRRPNGAHLRSLNSPADAAAPASPGKSMASSCTGTRSPTASEDLSSQLDFDLTVNNRSDDYGPCTSVVGVLFWMLEGLKYPFGIVNGSSQNSSASNRDSVEE